MNVYIYEDLCPLGYPVEHNLLSVTVLMEDCASADAFATAFMVMGLQDSKDFLSTHKKLEALLIYSDKNGDLSTLPIILGRKRTSYIVFWMSVLAMFGTVYYIYIHLYGYTYAIVYFLLFTLAPLLYFSIKIWDAKNKSDYTFLSKLLKVIMLLGMCSLLLYTFVII